jgi:hypothetical protein
VGQLAQRRILPSDRCISTLLVNTHAGESQPPKVKKAKFDHALCLWKAGVQGGPNGETPQGKSLLSRAAATLALVSGWQLGNYAKQAPENRGSSD